MQKNHVCYSFMWNSNVCMMCKLSSLRARGVQKVLLLLHFRISEAIAWSLVFVCINLYFACVFLYLYPVCIFMLLHWISLELFLCFASHVCVYMHFCFLSSKFYCSEFCFDVLLYFQLLFFWGFFFYCFCCSVVHTTEVELKEETVYMMKNRSDMKIHYWL